MKPLQQKLELIPIQATETTPETIVLSENGNKFASVDKCGYIKIFGDDLSISIEEARDILKIADNFELFFNNLKTQ